MKRRLLALTLIGFLLAPPPGRATYSDEEDYVRHSGGGSSMGEQVAGQAAAGALTYLVGRAMHKNDGSTGAADEPAAPPSVVTVVEFPVTQDVAQTGQVEVEIQKGKSTVNVNTPVNITQAPGGEDINKCCKLTSLAVMNIWHHAIKVSVGGKTQVVKPGQPAVFEGDLGECPRIKVESAEELGEDDAHLVAEDVSLCCKDLRTGHYKSFYAIRILRYTFVELDKDCGGGGKTTSLPPVTTQSPYKGESITPSVSISEGISESRTITPSVPYSQPPSISESITLTPTITPSIYRPSYPPSQPPTTDEKSDCACCCHQVNTWSAEKPIEIKYASPAGADVRVPLGKEFPLAVNAIDMDMLTVSCNQQGVECGSCSPCTPGGGGGITDGPVAGTGTGGGSTMGGNQVMIATTSGVCKRPCESCQSLKKIPLASPLHFRWELIAGPGWLKSNPYYPQERSAVAEGPAAVYVAPDSLPPGADRTVAILLTIDDTPYVADLDDPPVTETVTINLIGRKEVGSVAVVSPSLDYPTVTNPPPTCPCKPVTSWDAASGIKKTEEHDTAYSVCADSYTVLTAPTEDVDTIHAQCSGPKCSAPEVQYKLHDATTYQWKASAGTTIGILDSIVFQAPSSAGDVKVEGTATDSSIQYPDGALPLPPYEIKVGKITIESADVPPLGPGISTPANAPLMLGDDLTVKYKIEGAQFGKLEMRVYNKNGDVVYRRADLEGTIGSHETTWPKARWNQEPHIGAYANPKNGPYEIEIAAAKPRCVSAGSKYVDTKLVIQADIRDLKAGSATRASSLDTTIQYTRIKLKGPAEHDFFGGDILRTTIPGLAAGNYGKRLYVDKPFTLSRLEDGKWTISVYDNFDGVGNSLDTDPSTPQSDPYETEIELY
ncbi:MAG TPA: hypothetical protein VL688_02735 [Verrucomicrobiae bacterium]|jgi:hypothetical protein|nr:hypothetical protein [Verrucomicrobiae bacterium]